MSPRRYEAGNGLYLPPFILQIVGIAIVLGASAFWVLSGHQSALIMGAGLTLTAIGAYSGIHVEVRQDLRERPHHEEDEGP